LPKNGSESKGTKDSGRQQENANRFFAEKARPGGDWGQNKKWKIRKKKHDVAWLTGEFLTREMETNTGQE